MLALDQPVTTRADYDGGSHLADPGHDGSRVIALVGDDGLGLTTLQQRQGMGLFGGLAGGQTEIQRLAKTVGEQVDLGAQSASASPQSRVFGASFYGLRPPADAP